MALCRPATDGFWCACYLVSCVLHLVSVPVSKNLCYLHLCGSLYFLLAMMGYVTGAVRVILRVIRGKNLPGGRGGTGALSDNT